MNTNNWEIGKSLRMSKLFDEKTGRSVLVAMDHSFGGAHKGLEDPGVVLDKVLNGKPDGVIITPGTSRTYQSRFAGRCAPAMIVSIDYVLFHAFPGDTDTIEEQGMVTSVEEAIRLGADAIKVLMIHGREDPSMQARNFNSIGDIIEKAHRFGMPVIVEPTTWGHRFTPEKQKNANVLRDMARIAFEFGADVVKIDVPENPADFRLVAESCPVPLLVLGGAKKSGNEAMLSDVLCVVRNGAAGVTFGRNVWQHEKPEKIIAALKKVVFEEDVPGSLEILKG